MSNLRKSEEPFTQQIEEEGETTSCELKTELTLEQLLQDKGLIDLDNSDGLHTNYCSQENSNEKLNKDTCESSKRLSITSNFEENMELEYNTDGYCDLSLSILESSVLEESDRKLSSQASISDFFEKCNVTTVTSVTSSIKKQAKS